MHVPNTRPYWPSPISQQQQQKINNPKKRIQNTPHNNNTPRATLRNNNTRQKPARYPIFASLFAPNIANNVYLYSSRFTFDA